ncbi:LrgB family protein [Oceanobacillus saliphilus]|uniref:LrgB family protein n=1 Tax=Oceanobacillus saliphilus TaxID=2925834 RepID=UPI00201D4888|nr:LrgB family protein [Oceanobacillus saliphilus]
MSNLLIGITAIVGTLAVYLFTWKLHKKIVSPLTLPIFLGSIIIIMILAVFDIPYDTYMVGGEWINQLLGPAVVALAYPLYMQRNLLKQLIVPILCGTITGSTIGVASGILLAGWSGVDDYIIYSLVPKSVTTPVSMIIADSLGGVMSLAAVFVVIAGIGGVIMSPLVFKLFKVDHVIGRGVGMGSGSHAMGTAHSMEHSQLEGSISSVAMVLSAIVVSFIAPILVSLLM